MTKHQPTPGGVVLVAIDIAKARNETLIQIPGHARLGGPLFRLWREAEVSMSSTDVRS